MADTRVVTMPRLGESVVEGTIIRWLVQPGARVAEFDAIAEVETDKVSTEVPSPASGVIQVLLATEGQSVTVGAEIAIIAVEDTTRVSAAAGDTGGGTAHNTIGGTAELTRSEPSGAAESTGRNPQRYSPVVRALARSAGVDFANLEGSGEAGRVTRNDALAFVKRHTTAPIVPAEPVPQADREEKIPHTRIRRLIAQRMTLSKTTIPHAWQAQEVDMSGVVANRAANVQEFSEREGFGLTFLPYVVAATAAGLKQHRLVNATFMPDHLTLHHSINIGIAIGLEGGVVLPVIRDADGLSIGGIARVVADLTIRARENKLTADDLAGATFAVNNSGTFGTVLSYSVIAPGQAGILTMGAIKDRVVAISGSIAIRPMMFLSFSLDHRILDGLQAARFLSTCRERLESVRPETSIY